MPPAAVPPHLAAVLDDLIAHRKRVVVQIAGAPLAALRAAAGTPAMQATLAARPTPETGVRRRLRGALDAFARRAFGGGWARAWESEETRAGHQARAAYDQAVLEHVDPATLMDAADARFLASTDARLLAALAAQGYLPPPPQIHARQLAVGEAGPTAFAAPGVPGVVTMATDRLGGLLDALPTSPRHRVALAEEASEGRVPGFFGEHERQVFDRWFGVIHEAAHCAFAQIGTPFAPSPDRCSPAATKAVNRWVTGRLHAGVPGLSQALNEAHSDALAAMLLLEATDHHPQARLVVEEWRVERQKNREADEYAGGLPTHPTEWTLERVLAQPDEWRGQPPAALRALALRYASDGWLEMVHPDRVLPDGEPQGTRLIASLLPSGLLADGLADALESMAWSHAWGGRPRAWLEAELGSHPLYPVARRVWERLEPQLEAVLACPAHGHATVRAAVLALDFRAAEPVIARVQEAVAALDREGPAFARAADAYRADLPRILETLGAPVGPSLPELRRARLARTSASAPRAPRP